MQIFRLAARSVVLLTTGPALLAFTACTVSSVTILLTISGPVTPGPASAGPAPSFHAPATAAAPAVHPAPAGGSAAVIASVPVDPPAPARSPVRAPARTRRRPGGNGRRPTALADQPGDGTVCYGWITGVRNGRPGRVTLQISRCCLGNAAAREAAVKINGQFAGPLYEVGFGHRALVFAYQVFRP